jgi:hypothetical protein
MSIINPTSQSEQREYLPPYFQCPCGSNCENPVVSATFNALGAAYSQIEKESKVREFKATPDNTNPLPEGVILRMSPHSDDLGVFVKKISTDDLDLDALYEEFFHYF